jgi:chlorobactene glucosyltransferase
MHAANQLIDIYQIVVTALACLLAANTLLNFLYFRKPRALIASDDNLPFISILVPARNEDHTIAACVERLLAQNYASFEVIVLDDGSNDETCNILNRLWILVGGDLPEGWCAKTFACWQLANAAEGEYLLFPTPTASLRQMPCCALTAVL